MHIPSLLTDNNPNLESVEGRRVVVEIISRSNAKVVMGSHKRNIMDLDSRAVSAQCNGQFFSKSLTGEKTDCYTG